MLPTHQLLVVSLAAIVSTIRCTNVDQADTASSVLHIFPPTANATEADELQPESNATDGAASSNSGASSKGFYRNILNDIYFELYTRRNRNAYATSADQFRAYFRPADQTKILIHGYNTDTRGEFVQTVKDAYLDDRECNVIAVAWPSTSLNYPAVAASTHDVGTVTARLVEYLHQVLGAEMRLIHLIGHSLGAHAAGFAGLLSTFRIVRISGLDAAMPGFAVFSTPPNERLDASDADYVDAIHSCGGTLGQLEPYASVDFYPNSGKAPQPGCGLGLATVEVCSHGRAWVYWRESIRSPVGFWGHAGCATWWAFERGECARPTALMGDPASAAAGGLGVQYLRTSDRAPYALGYV